MRKKKLFKLISFVLVIAVVSTAVMAFGYNRTDVTDTEFNSLIRSSANMSEQERAELEASIDSAIAEGHYYSFTEEELIAWHEERVATARENLERSEKLLESYLANLEISRNVANVALADRQAAVERDREILKTREIVLANLPARIEAAREYASTGSVMAHINCAHNNKGPQHIWTETFPYSDSTRCGTIQITFSDFFCRDCNNWVVIVVSQTIFASPHTFVWVGGIRLCSRCGRVDNGAFTN
jgi:hypothetical protein